MNEEATPEKFEKFEESDWFDKTKPLYGADPDCEHELVLRWSGYGCRKCPGWFCT